MRKHFIEVVLTGLIWIALGIPGAGMFLAKDLHGPLARAARCREDAGFAYGLAVVGGPFTTVMAFFLTGFAQYGFQFTCKESDNAKSTR